LEKPLTVNEKDSDNRSQVRYQEYQQGA
jgi:hypothetical protein